MPTLATLPQLDTGNVVSLFGTARKTASQFFSPVAQRLAYSDPRLDPSTWASLADPPYQRDPREPADAVGANDPRVIASEQRQREEVAAQAGNATGLVNAQTPDWLSASLQRVAFAVFGLVLISIGVTFLAAPKVADELTTLRTIRGGRGSPPVIIQTNNAPPAQASVNAAHVIDAAFTPHPPKPQRHAAKRFPPSISHQRLEKK